MPSTTSQDIEKMSYTQLKAHSRHVGELMTQRQAETRDKLAKMAADADLRLADIKTAPATKPATATEPVTVAKAANGNGKHQAKPAKVRKAKGAAVAVKYRDPQTNETWSGRGRMAGWLDKKVKAGAKAEAYKV